MDDADIALRNLTYRMFVEAGGRLTAEDVAARVGIPTEQVGEAWRRLYEAHAIVLLDSGDGLRMLNPFSAVPTSYRVHAKGRRWYANCAWDAFGVLAALHVDGRIEATCSDCGGPSISRFVTRPQTARR